MMPASLRAPRSLVSSRRRRAASLLVVFGLLLPSVGAGTEEMQDVELLVGSTTSISIGRGSDVDVVVGSRDVIGVTPLVEQGTVVVTGLAPGVSSLSIWVDRRRQLYRVRVHGTPPARLVAELGRLLTGIEGLEIKRVGDRVFVDGAVGHEADRARVERITGLYGGEVESLVRVDPSASRVPMIALEFQVVELREADGTQIGLDWPTRISVGVTASLNVRHVFGDARGALDDRETPSVVADTADLMIGLNLAVAEGLAEIRNVSTVVTEVGRRARYAAGGEFLVRTTGINAGGLERIVHGTRLEVEPRVDDARHLQLQITAAVSSLDASEQVDGLPTLMTNEIQTAVNLELGETVILSGLDAQTRSRTETGLWPLARIPVIGYLFETRRERESKRRSVIFVTPTIYRPGDALHGKVLTPLLDRWAEGSHDD